ncbi:MAG: DUF4202 domain-containing protein [Candidatus Omnitrophica bacterium]|nr:DUF4202 domain-containing protein [Candidatus Omnitrophota bacterium]
MNRSERFQQTIEKFDQANSQDPNGKELLYAQRMSQWLERLEPTASEAVQLAARSQHIRRWEIPRTNYPKTRAGYLQWRTTLYEFHAQKAGAILKEAGYDPRTIERVQTLLRKKNIKTDPDMQLLEDVICLVFLENYFAEFSKQHEEQKIIEIVRKTWNKMSPRGQQAALQLKISPETLILVEKALQK